MRHLACRLLRKSEDGGGGLSRAWGADPDLYRRVWLRAPNGYWEACFLIFLFDCGERGATPEHTCAEHEENMQTSISPPPIQKRKPGPASREATLLYYTTLRYQHTFCFIAVVICFLNQRSWCQLLWLIAQLLHDEFTVCSVIFRKVDSEASMLLFHFAAHLFESV